MTDPKELADQLREGLGRLNDIDGAHDWHHLYAVCDFLRSLEDRGEAHTLTGMGNRSVDGLTLVGRMGSSDNGKRVYVQGVE